MEDDDFTCDCPPRKGGWKGAPPVALDGKNWPLDFAAKMLGMSERDLRDLIRVVGLKPSGTVKMADFRRSGRHPRTYDAAKLVKLHQVVEALLEELSDTQDED